MIITLIVVVGFLAGIGILIHWWRHDYFNDSLEWLGFMLITIFGIGLLIVGIVFRCGKAVQIHFPDGYFNKGFQIAVPARLKFRASCIDFKEVF